MINYSLSNFEICMIYNFVFLHKFLIYLFTALAMNTYSVQSELLLLFLTYSAYFHRRKPNVWPNFTRQLNEHATYCNAHCVLSDSRVVRVRKLQTLLKLRFFLFSHFQTHKSYLQ